MYRKLLKSLISSTTGVSFVLCTPLLYKIQIPEFQILLILKIDKPQKYESINILIFQLLPFTENQKFWLLIMTILHA